MSDDDVRGGYPVGGHHPERNGGLLPEDSESPTRPALPADLAAVRADDAMLDALCGPDPSPESSDARLTQVLMAWRHEVDTDPVIQLVDTDTALAVLARARRPEPRRNPVLVPFAAAAAVLVIAFSGVGVGARTAEPGDRLWPLTKVLYTDHAQSVEAAAEVRVQLAQASDALAQGDAGEAQVALARVEDQLRGVTDEESRAELEGKAEELRVELGYRPGNDDRAGATSSSDPEPAPIPGSPPPSVDLSTAPPTEGPPAVPPTEEPPTSGAPADPGSGTGGTEGGGSAPAPRSAPPPPAVPAAPVPPESSPEG